MAKWIELLKPGTWTDRAKKSVTITKEMIKRIHDNYKAENPAHILVGHPDKPKVPSFGIIDALKMSGDVLLFKPGKVVAEFAALVGKGAFPGVSAGLSADCSQLNHVAFLSAERPSIDGLKPALEFSAVPDINTVSIDITKEFDAIAFSAASDWFRWRVKDIGILLRNVKNYLIEKDGQEKADKIMGEYDLNSLQADPPDEIFEATQFSHTPQGGTMDFEKLYTELKTLVDGLLAKFAKPGMVEFSAHVDSLASENARLAQENTALKTQVATFETDLRGKEFSTFVEQLIAERKVKPDEKESIVKNMEQMFAVTPVEFSTADGKKSPLDIFKAELSARPVTVPKTGEEKGAHEFSAGGAIDGVALGNQMSQYMKEMKAKGTPVSVIEAQKHFLG